jgi:uncharacterized membrane protein
MSEATTVNFQVVTLTSPVFSILFQLLTIIHVFFSALVSATSECSNLPR